MAYFGKEFKYVREEKFEDFLKAVGLPEEEVQKYLNARPSVKFEKDGDEYTLTLTTPKGSKISTFQSGVELEEFIKEGVKAKTTYTVEGDTVSQVINSSKGTATFVREFSDNEIVVTLTSSIWDGEAKTFYKADD